MSTSETFARKALEMQAGQGWIGWLRILLICAALVVVSFGVLDHFGTDYTYLAAYTILQFVVLATAWNILAGYAGYVNFGSAGFFAIGVYTSVVLYKTLQPPVYLTLPVAGLAAGLVGLAMGYLTLRLRGVFFSIATFALAIMLSTIIINWPFVGGARGVYIVRPGVIEGFGTYARYLFAIMLGLAIFSVLVARALERSWLGRGLGALRDDEAAAECAGVPTLRLKLIATAVSGALMGMAGAPFPYFVSFVDPATAFNLQIALNTIAMPLIGGIGTWIGPVLGAILLGSLQQIAAVTISSAANVLVVGLLLMIFVAVAPKGIVGLYTRWRETRE